MLTYVLDCSAVLRFADEEAGVDRVDELLFLALTGRCKVLISAVNWGEVVYILTARSGSKASSLAAVQRFRRTAEVISTTEDRSAHAGLLKLKYDISDADAFGVELATDSPDHILVTADYGAKPAEHDIQIEFLPVKAKP